VKPARTHLAGGWQLKLKEEVSAINLRVLY